MSFKATLEIRREELRRRVEALPREVKDWQARASNDLDSNLHFSQLQAIGVLMDAFIGPQSDLLTAMDPGGDPLAFQDAAFELVKKIIGSQRAWDFFRDKLELRFSPMFKEVLWVADTVAWNCYAPVMDKAAGLYILDRSTLREPPLTYLTAEFSPATWVRGSRPNDGRDYDRNFYLGTSNLPIPVIELPWDHVENIWEFMTLHHEVGHDLEADLKLREPLAASLEAVLKGAGVPDNRIQQWLQWQGEVFADFVGLQLGGPPFAETLMHLLLLPAGIVTTFNPDDPHPTHYTRVLMNAAYIPTMIPGHQPLVDHGKQIADTWVAIYGKQLQFAETVGDFPLIFQALMDTKLPVLQGKSVRELMPYTVGDDQRIRYAVDFMLTGMNQPSKLEPRHCVSAARLAVTQASLAGAITDDALTQINQRTMALVKVNAAPGLRGGDASTPHKNFIASFADKW